MARKTVRVDIPANPEKCMTLLANVLKKNAKDGTKSPLSALPMELLAELSGEAGVHQEKAKDLAREAELETELRDKALGKGTQSPDTARFILAQIRDVLLGLHRDDPRALGLWGFEVVEGEAPVGKKKPSK